MRSISEILSDIEVRAYVARHLRNVAFFGQKCLRGSRVSRTGDGFLAFKQPNFGASPKEAPFDPKYLLALASDADLPAVPASILEDNSTDHGVARLTRLLDDTVVQLMAVIVERDAYKAAVAEWSKTEQ